MAPRMEISSRELVSVCEIPWWERILRRRGVRERRERRTTGRGGVSSSHVPASASPPAPTDRWCSRWPPHRATPWRSPYRRSRLRRWRRASRAPASRTLRPSLRARARGTRFLATKPAPHRPCRFPHGRPYLSARCFTATCGGAGISSDERTVRFQDAAASRQTTRGERLGASAYLESRLRAREPRDERLSALS